MKPSRGIGIIDTPSNHPVDETVEKLKGILQAKGVTLFALLGAASITGVPAFGLPKISSLVGRIFSPAFSASPLWSTRANRVTPFACKIPLSFWTVSSTE